MPKGKPRRSFTTERYNTDGTGEIEAQEIRPGTDVLEFLEKWRTEQKEEYQKQLDMFKSLLEDINRVSRDVQSVLPSQRNLETTNNNDALTTVMNTVQMSNTINTGETSSSTTGTPSDVGMTSIENNQHSRISGVPLLYATEGIIPALPKRPTFDGSGEINPVRFLEQLERYYRRLDILDRHKVDVALDCLEQDALYWADVYRGNWKDYTQFRRAFLNRYWSAAEQFKLRNKICTSKWEPEKRSMGNHLAFFISQAKLLTDLIPESTLVAELIRHFPTEIQALWQAADRHSISQLAEFIGKQEALFDYPTVGKTLATRTEPHTTTIEPPKRVHTTSQHATLPRFPSCKQPRLNMGVGGTNRFRWTGPNGPMTKVPPLSGNERRGD